jgi:hypothetical protein
MNKRFPLILIVIIMISSCKETVKLDKQKLDKAYFVGEYQTDYLGIIETLNLKIDGTYDYELRSENQDTVLKGIGSWKLIKTEKYNPLIYFENYPNIRTNKVYGDEGDRTNPSFNLQMGGSYMGDLEAYVLDKDAGEGYYTFVKQDKSRNKDYLLKTKQ